MIEAFGAARAEQFVVSSINNAFFCEYFGHLKIPMDSRGEYFYAKIIEGRIKRLVKQMGIVVFEKSGSMDFKVFFKGEITQEEKDNRSFDAARIMIEARYRG